jgi:hypothetical protein
VAIITTYICDCCGAQSTDITKFAGQPAMAKVGNWSAAISGGLFCTVCMMDLAAGANALVAGLLNSKTGQEL